GAVLFFFLALRPYASARRSLVATYVFGLYPPVLRGLYLLMSETFALFLMSASAYYISRALRSDSPGLRKLLMPSLLPAGLALTRVMFGYVLAGQVVVLGLLYLCKRTALLRSATALYLLALILTLPYLAYTYALTGRPFYWGSSGGMSLYWMSTPYRDELGDWRSEDAVFNNQL